ncbi:PREDICTED: nuclear transcription factor Y subunit alpha-like [Erythranthe guttata]|uniref:nuclear transcription factor Y subunit alpha-like n=1 Tax=Erythranthe guttata TaxID=4155 RepID=UPI00064D90A7|nr:PREDICTED: nuclear transcription factor Y subunit alpha-like [Erythranthe guttata]|eukprot:XP_012851910.1 PREDICTED: nuclear transcription factor Y subunit alpha-like [Erythranthe guttata]
MEGEKNTLVSNSSELEVAKNSVNSNISILVVDDDTTCLAIVAAILKKFKYQVMSADEKECVALKGLENGAAFFILKPVSPDDVKDLWQFAAMKKKTPAAASTGGAGGGSDRPDTGTGAGAGAGAGASSSGKEESSKNKKESKRKSPQKSDGNSDERKGETSQSGSQKKPKVVWTNSLHNCFLEAIRSIGLDRAVPKKILEVMNVPGLTRENVASHLQKYRIFLRRVSDASSKIQYTSDHKGLSRSIIRSGLGLSSFRSGTIPQTLISNGFNRFPFRSPGNFPATGIHNNNTNNLSSLLNLEKNLPPITAVQSGFGQSRLLSSNETAPAIKPSILGSYYPNMISDRTYLRQQDYQTGRNPFFQANRSNNISLQDLSTALSASFHTTTTTTTTITPAYDNVGTSTQTSNYVGYSMSNLKQYLSKKHEGPSSWLAPVNNNNIPGDGLRQLSNAGIVRTAEVVVPPSADHQNVVVANNVEGSNNASNFVMEGNGTGDQLLSDVVRQVMLPNSYNNNDNNNNNNNLPLVCGDVENGGGVNNNNNHEAADFSPMFDLSEFDIFSTTQLLQTPSTELGDHHFDQNILSGQGNASSQNQPQQNGDDIMASSNLYDGTISWDHIVACLDQTPDQQHFGEGLTNSLGFNNKTPSSPTEHDEDDFLESLLAPFADDDTGLEGI